MTTAATRDWHPQQTWVFVVGTLEWKHPDQFAPFPQENRRDEALVRFFTEQGVPDAQVLYLQDKHATLAQIEQALATHLPKAQKKDLLFLYYCGHGYKLDAGNTCFASYDAGDEGIEGWDAATIPAAIEQYFPGQRAFLAADCCCSGGLTESVEAQADRIAYACLTSSSANESSTGNWTFTEGLLAGLSGEAYSDADDSQGITLAEVANQIIADMAFAEEQRTSFMTTGAFNPHMVLASAQRKTDVRIGERVEVYTEGEWYKARIIGANAKNGAYKVHYYGWEASDDECVNPNQMRTASVTEYTIGETVEVKWHDKWYPAVIQGVQGNLHLIQYVDYAATWDEWVGSRRMRRAK